MKIKQFCLNTIHTKRYYVISSAKYTQIYNITKGY